MTGMRPPACSTAVLISRQCSSTVDGRRFAGRADDDDAGRAVRDMEIDELAQRRQVERPALLHRRRDGDEASGQHCRQQENSGILPQRRDGARRASTAAATRLPQSRRSGGGHARPAPTAASRCTTAGLSPTATRPCSNATTVSGAARRPQSAIRRGAAGNRDSTAGRTPRCPARTFRRAARRRRRAPRAAAATAAGAGS